MSVLSDIVAKFRKGSPNIAAAFDEVERRLVLLEATEPPPPPPGPVTAPLFDGLATRMVSVYGSTKKVGDPSWDGNSNATQDPWMWGKHATDRASGVYFITDSVKLQADPTYGKVYALEIGPGDTNPYYDQPTRPNGEFTISRPVAVGQVDWYANAFKILSPYTLGSFNVICQYAYPSLYSPPLSISFDSGGLGIDRHVGIIPVGGGSSQYVIKPRFLTLADVYDKWVEYVIGVQWAVDTNGWINVYTRVRERGETQFTLRYSDATHPTQQKTSGQAMKTTMTDKMGLYFGTFTSPPTNRVHHRGFTRWDNKTDAIASMG